MGRSGLTPELSSFREGPGPSAKDEAVQRVSSVNSATGQSGIHLGCKSGISLAQVLTKHFETVMKQYSRNIPSMSQLQCLVRSCVSFRRFRRGSSRGANAAIQRAQAVIADAAQCSRRCRRRHLRCCHRLRRLHRFSPPMIAYLSAAAAAQPMRSSCVRNGRAAQHALSPGSSPLRELPHATLTRRT